MATENPTSGLKLSKNRKIILVLLGAFLCMLAAGAGAYMLLTPQRTTIFIFNQDYSAGVQVTRSMLSSVQVDSSAVTGGARLPTGDYFVTGVNYESVIQSAGVLRTDVHSGAALMGSMLTTTGGNSIEMKMRKNAIAVTIGANNISGVTDELAFGSRVNVYVSYNGDTILLHQNLRVLKTTWANGLNSVTLEVDHAQSLELIHAQTFGLIHLGLVDANGYQYTIDERPSYNITGFTVPANTEGDGTYEWAPNPNSTYENSKETEDISEPVPTTIIISTPTPIPTQTPDEEIAVIETDSVEDITEEPIN
jgi:hypothetical protein